MNQHDHDHDPFGLHHTPLWITWTLVKSGLIPQILDPQLISTQVRGQLSQFTVPPSSRSAVGSTRFDPVILHTNEFHLVQLIKVYEKPIQEKGLLESVKHCCIIKVHSFKDCRYNSQSGKLIICDDLIPFLIPGLKAFPNSWLGIYGGSINYETLEIVLNNSQTSRSLSCRVVHILPENVHLNRDLYCQQLYSLYGTKSYSHSKDNQTIAVFQTCLTNYNSRLFILRSKSSERGIQTVSNLAQSQSSKRRVEVPKSSVTATSLSDPNFRVQHHGTSTTTSVSRRKQDDSSKGQANCLRMRGQTSRTNQPVDQQPQPSTSQVQPLYQQAQLSTVAIPSQLQHSQSQPSITLRNLQPPQPSPSTTLRTIQPPQPTPSSSSQATDRPAKRSRTLQTIQPLQQPQYVYHTLSELKDQLVHAKRSQIFTLLKRNVYGIVVDVLTPKSPNSYHILITDETVKDVPVRIHTFRNLSNKPQIGPEICTGDIIRIHRATVQNEANNDTRQMVISTSPHHNYTLFDYIPNVPTAEIEKKSLAKSITFTEDDQKRIMELRTFADQT